MGDVSVGLTQDHTRLWGENTNGQLLSLIGTGPDLHLKKPFYLSATIAKAGAGGGAALVILAR